MTIMETLQWANNKLRKADVDSPMLDAEILLAFALETNKAWLFAHFNDRLKTHQLERFHTLVDRRAAREPVAYLVGTKAFYGREFVVTPAVLIPRPETETLIEEALAILENADPELTILCDIGTGSGAIAVTLACETKLPVIAVDVSQDALAVAKQNAHLHQGFGGQAATLGAGDLVDFQLGHLAEPLVRIFKTIRGQTAVKTSSVYPFKHLLIAANLPYLPESKLETLQPEVRDFEPRGALIAGVDGLDAYFELFRSLRTHRRLLPRRVSVLIEIDPPQRSQTLDLITHAFPTCEPVVKQDLRGDDRVVVVEL